jgi:hypothetical protein
MFLISDENETNVSFFPSSIANLSELFDKNMKNGLWHVFFKSVKVNKNASIETLDNNFYNNIKSTILKTKFPIKTHVGMYSQINPFW